MDVARENTPGKLQMLVLERRDEGCNMARFYVLAIEPTHGAVAPLPATPSDAST